MEKVFELIEKHLQKNLPGSKMIYLAHSGSRLHGTSTPSSDTDVKGIYVPSLDSTIAQDYPGVVSINTNEEGKNSKEDIDIELFSVKEFIYLLGRGELNMIELLFSMKSEFKLFETEASKIFLENYEGFLVNKTLAFTGFAMKQASKYSVKGDRVEELEKVISVLENLSDKMTKKELKSKKLKEFRDIFREEFSSFRYVKEEEREEGSYLIILNRLHNYENTIGHTLKLLNGVLSNYGARAQKAKGIGIDYKAVSHAIRALEEAIELLKTKNIDFPLRNSEYLRSVKMGELSIEETSVKTEELYMELESVSSENDFPLQLDQKFCRDILISVTKKVWG
jgi:hypothetical protein